jgi:hypothetical protein
LRQQSGELAEREPQDEHEGRQHHEHRDDHRSGREAARDPVAFHAAPHRVRADGEHQRQEDRRRDAGDRGQAEHHHGGSAQPHENRRAAMGYHRRSRYGRARRPPGVLGA